MIRVPATPAAKRLARESGIALTEIDGTGPQGWVKARDVLAYRPRARLTPVASAMAQYYHITSDRLPATGARRVTKADVLALVAAEQSLPPAAAAPAVPRQGTPIQGIRRIIAQRMVQSLAVAAQYTNFADYDMSNVLSLYNNLRPAFGEKHGLKLTITDILVKLVALALERHRNVNSSLIDDAIVVHDEINVGIAVATDEGLIVPVLRQADAKSLREVAAARSDLVARARTRKLLPDEITGGTFTLSNLGMYPVDYMTPIINQPESGILGVGRIVEKVVPINGKIEIRPMAGFSLTFDHRHLDGAESAKFLATLDGLLQNPFVIMV